MSGGKITAYLDCVSPYSYFALLHLSKNIETLKSHNVELDIIPVFLGGINVGSGNKPPWTLPAKAAYSKYDSARAASYHGVPDLRAPSFFPILSLLPQRALVYIKASHPDLYIQVFIDIFHAMWEHGVDVSKPELLAKTLGKRLSEEQVRVVLEKANDSEYKGILNANTKEALDRGAFGCPWFFVRNSKGDEEPFFGSDRFHFMWHYLGLPYQDVELLPATQKAKI